MAGQRGMLSGRPRSFRAGSRRGGGVEYVGLGTFDPFLDVGCFQGFGAGPRAAMGRGVTALANPGATLLMLAFGATRLRNWLGGVTQNEVEEAFPGWALVAVDAAPTRGLGWPMNRTSPQWYRLRHRPDRRT